MHRMKRAFILDLDNTIYPVSSIAGELFGQLFKLIDEHLLHADPEHVQQAKDELTRRPYQHVAKDFNFGEELTTKGMALLNNITFDQPMQPYDEYATIKEIEIEKYLVTTGFTRLQMSKIKMLGIEADFKAVYVVDPELSSLSKKDIFEQIMQENGYEAADLLIIGDDPKSEIKAATELGIDTFLFDPGDKHHDAQVTYRSKDYKDVVKIASK